MRLMVKSIAAGSLSGVFTYFASTQALGYTNAFVMPGWMPLALWQALVVLGVGAALVALIVQLLALVAFSARAPVALASFLAVALVALALTVPAAVWPPTFIAWALGAALATLVFRRLRPNHSFKPTPLRGAA